MSETLETPTFDVGTDGVCRSVLIAHDRCNEIRWQAGQRLQHLFEEHCASDGSMIALEVDGVSVSFAELDSRANRMAHYFQAQGVRGGDRIGLIVDRSVSAYVALLAVLKLDAAYVPLDIKFPADRISFIAHDADIKAFVTTAAARALVADLDLPIFELEAVMAAAAEGPASAIEGAAGGLPDDRLCYIIYTSGSTGRPKGVAVNHSSIYNFVLVAAEAYGYESDDRVYQGMTLAFDFSVEELWVPLLSGATLVPSPADRQMVGSDLAAFLAERRITAMCCVPTLLATIDEELPDLRLLLVSGEACPADIVARWHRPWRRMLNAYGPTEATVTATWTEVEPGRPVTIGVPLPTYSIAILETARDKLVEEGTVGEIAIGGIGLAEGYVNRNDLTAKAFVPDFLHLANNPSQRLYRTGDLGRINDDGEIEYLGRIDAQVKIRGYRIELAEIENVLLEMDGIAQAVVTTYESQPGLVELAAYYTCFEDGPKPSRERLLRVLRGRLPTYMVPAYVEELAIMPLLASHKADRKALPAPSSMRLVSRSADGVAPRDDVERVIADCLAETLGLDEVSVEDNFFDDLGAHSLLMGQFIADLNARMPRAKAAISDVYLAPNVALLAKAIEDRAKADGAQERRQVEPAYVASDFDYLRCGALQAVFYVVQYGVQVTLALAAVLFVSDGTALVDVTGRALLAACVWLSITMALPIATKWALIGRWTEEDIPIWSMRYFRFWVVQKATAMSPWVTLRGTALFNVYLRLLGAKVGHGAVVLGQKMPLATDLLRIGDYAVLRKGAHVSGYRAENGYIRTGPIEIGDYATIGERSLLDIGTSVGDEGQLGHASALLQGQAVPARTRYHGSPAIETSTEFRHLPHAPTSTLRRSLFAGARLLSIVLLMAAMLAVFAVLYAGVGEDARVTADSGTIAGHLARALGLSLGLLVGGYVLSLLAHIVVPRVLSLLLVTGKVYPLYGLHHFVAQMIGVVALSQRFQMLFGDSAAAVHYFRWLGMRQPNVKQTGSNFGTTMAYDTPLEVEIGSGSMISDGLAVANMEFGSGSFRIAPTTIGAGCFLGNTIVYPSAAKLGDNCLLGTKVMVPIDGRVRSDVGLLGSPCFEIPREAGNQQRFNAVPSTPAEHQKLREKNAYNLRTAIWYLASQWMALFGLFSIGVLTSVSVAWLGDWAVVVGLGLAPVWLIAHAILAERMSLVSLADKTQHGLRMSSHYCTIHEPYFWRVERHWKFDGSLFRNAFTGTPFRGVRLRMVGLRVGRKVFDDGGTISEKALTEIGDNCCLNAGVSIQGHSLEDGLFKSEPIVIGDGCTVGPMGFVHYGVRMENNSMLSSDAFLMKGATAEASSYWRGNPAQVV